MIGAPTHAPLRTASSASQRPRDDDRSLVFAAPLSRLPARGGATTSRSSRPEGKGPARPCAATRNWQPDRLQHPVLVLVHGLEGSSDSSYMLGIAEKAFRAEFSVIRMNQRNCGGTEKLDTHSLQLRSLRVTTPQSCANLSIAMASLKLFFCGYSMGGNLVMKMAGELGDAAPPQLKAVGVVCPALDLAAGADAIAEPRNFLYEWRFVSSLKARARRKAALFPGAIQLGWNRKSAHSPRIRRSHHGPKFRLPRCRRLLFSRQRSALDRQRPSAHPGARGEGRPNRPLRHALRAGRAGESAHHDGINGTRRPLRLHLTPGPARIAFGPKPAWWSSFSRNPQCFAKGPLRPNCRFGVRKPDPLSLL